MSNWIVLVADDPEIQRAAVAALNGRPRADRLYSRLYDGARIVWRQYDAGRWFEIADIPRLPDGNDNAVALSGHGNNQAIGRENADPGDLSPEAVSELLWQMNFRGNRVVISACGTNALLGPFGSQVVNGVIRQYAAHGVQYNLGQFGPPAGVAAPTGPIGQDVNPLSGAGANFVLYQWQIQ